VHLATTAAVHMAAIDPEIMDTLSCINVPSWHFGSFLVDYVPNVFNNSLLSLIFFCFLVTFFTHSSIIDLHNVFRYNFTTID
jgi:hypothetical protein